MPPFPLSAGIVSVGVVINKSFRIATPLIDIEQYMYSTI